MLLISIARNDPLVDCFCCCLQRDLSVSLLCVRGRASLPFLPKFQRAGREGQEQRRGQRRSQKGIGGDLRAGGGVRDSINTIKNPSR